MLQHQSYIQNIQIGIPKIINAKKKRLNYKISNFLDVKLGNPNCMNFFLLNTSFVNEFINAVFCEACVSNFNDFFV